MNVKAGIMINGIHSYTDLGLYLASREVIPAARRTNFVSLPYMNGYYDMSAIVAPYYGSRPLKYSFDILEDDEVAVEAKKNEIYDWVITAVESKIYDDADPDYYYVGSFTSMDYSSNSELPDCGGQITLNFTAQPYRYNRLTDEGVIGCTE